MRECVCVCVCLQGLRENGEPGVTGVEGEEGEDPESEEAERLLLRRMVMLRETGEISSAFEGSILLPERTRRDLYLRSFPMPESGVGPASVSSQRLWRKPMIDLKNYCYN